MEWAEVVTRPLLFSLQLDMHVGSQARRIHVQSWTPTLLPITYAIHHEYREFGTWQLGTIDESGYLVPSVPLTATPKTRVPVLVKCLVARSILL